MYSPPQILMMIENRLTELGMSQAQLGMRAFGKADNSAIQSLKRGSSPGIDRLEAMAHALGWELYFGPPRPKLNELNEHSADHDFHTRNPLRAGYLPIPWHEPTAGSGSAPIAFQDSWLQASGLNIDTISAVAGFEINLPGVDSHKTLALIDHAAPKRGFALWSLKDSKRRSIAATAFDGDDMIIESAEHSMPPRLVRNWRGSDVVPEGQVVWLGFIPGR